MKDSISLLLLLWTLLMSLSSTNAMAMIMSITTTKLQPSRQSPRVGGRVCTSSTCAANGSEMLLEALDLLAVQKMNVEEEEGKGDSSSTNNNNNENVVVEFKSDYCLGGCCKGVVVKKYGEPRRETISGLLATEQAALQAAKSLLLEWNIPINDRIWKELQEEVLQQQQQITGGAGKSSSSSIFTNSQPPEICSNCGIALQLYRGNCAKCGKYPY